MADLQLQAIKAAKLTVVNLHEDDSTATWFCTLATTYRSPMNTWKTGKGKTADDAMDNALGLAYMPKPKAKPTRRNDEDLV